VNEVHGIPGVGKTNVALVVALDVLSRGGTVAYVDLQDTPTIIVGRLQSFGVEKKALRERFHYWQRPPQSTFVRIVRICQ